MFLPTTPDEITAPYLDALLRGYPGAAYIPVTGFDVQRLSKGTSGAGLYVVTIERTPAGPLRFILKLSNATNEVYLYRDLAPRLPVATPGILDARVLDDGTTWILMEEITGVKDGLDWTEGDYRAVLTGMAQLHAAFWSRPDLLADCPWLSRPTDQHLQSLVAQRKTDLQTLLDSGLPTTLPEVFSAERLALGMRLLDQPDRLFGTLFRAGTALVHGDYWFYNVQITEPGRVVLVDWQDPQLWSGLWELTYFFNLLLVVSATEYRTALPYDEDLMIGWYVEALTRAGVTVPQADFDASLLAARAWHPIQHWVRQYAHAIGHGLLPTKGLREKYPGAVGFLASTFARWEEDARAILD